MVTSALGMMLGTALIIAYSFGVFLKSLTQEFHAGRAAISLAFTFHNLIGALSIAASGRLIDRYGARRVILPFTVMFNVILFCAEAVSGKIWQLYLFVWRWALSRAGRGLCLTAMWSRTGSTGAEVWRSA